MFQNFDAPSSPVVGDTRLKMLRGEMEKNGISLVLVPHNDEQNNEYLPVDKERLAWLSGFTGSAGCALVTLDQAILFVDGRYTLQAQQQIDLDHWTVESLIDYPPNKWLENAVTQDDVLGFDPWLHTAQQVRTYKKAMAQSGGSVQPLKQNLIDEIWQGKPASPLEQVRIHDFEFAGRLTNDKLREVISTIKQKGADACVITDPSSVCWLFNIRGGDVSHTPITLAHAIIRCDGEPILIIDQRKLDIETKAFLTQVCDMQPPSKLDELVADIASSATKVVIDGSSSPYAFQQIVEQSGGEVVDAKDPISLPRAIKNQTEIEGSRQAHLRDGVAFASFLCWLNAHPPGTLDEITAAKKLEELRRDHAGDMPLRDISFDTISGSGPNGAIVHYRVTEATNRVLQNGELYLSDSGGQYDDGTTDITRTIAIGDVGEDERHAFTLVLRGHIAIALARFPKGTRGVDIDALARMPLWQHGMDYAHGTGHGVGSYLSVHEGPQNISKRGMQEFLPGMIVSNEPGYYRSGAFGIRIENLVLVREEMEIDGGDQSMLGFETLTLAPIDQRLIDPTMMNDDELHWLNAYHGWVRRKLEPLVAPDVAEWLAKATEPMIRELPAASA